MPELIWIVVFLIVFVSSMVFIKKTISGASIMENVYAKKIALIIDGARPGSVFILNVSDAIEIAEKNKIKCSVSSCFKVENNSVQVKLSNEKGDGHIFFSSYNVNLQLNSDNTLIINVND